MNTFLEFDTAPVIIAYFLPVTGLSYECSVSP